MAKAKILFVDNDLDFLNTRSEFLKREGYEVVPVSTPLDAIGKANSENFDLAIVDIRLLNDDDDRDNSGLELAKRLRDTLPIIILTNYPLTEYLRRALAVQTDGTRIAYDLVDKRDGPIALLSSIRNTLTISHRQNKIQYQEYEKISLQTLPPVTLDVPAQMLKDYELARSQADAIARARLIVFVGGIIVVFIGALLFVVKDKAAMFTIISGAIATGVGELYARLRFNDAFRRWEQFHKELALFYRRDNSRQHRPKI